MIFAAGIGARSVQRFEMEEAGSPPPTSDFSAQIAEDIRSAISVTGTAENEADWAASGYTPHDVFRNVRALHESLQKRTQAVGLASAAPAALCASLSALSDVDLTLFENELSDPASKLKLDCAPALRARISSWWTAIHAASPKAARLASSEIAVDSGRGSGHDSGWSLQGALKPGQVALVVVGPGAGGANPRDSRAILETLKSSGIRANYFLTGDAVNHYPGLARERAASGQVVASLAMSGTSLAGLALRRAQDEIDKGRRAVAAGIGLSVPFFRFPFGARTDALDRLLKTEGLTNFDSSLDSGDWRTRDPEKVALNVSRLLDRARGGIIVLHETPQTALALPRVIAELARRDFETVVFVPR
jgi:hypothetical protein